MNVEEAKHLFGANLIGPQELKGYSGSFSFDEITAMEIPFSDEVLQANAKTHLLLFASKKFADGVPVTINEIGKRLGMDPSVSEPCMYNQDWYVKEDFAAVTTPDNQWHLIAKNVLENARAKMPDDIEHNLEMSEVFPSAVVLTFTFFAYCFATNERLWVNDFLWCSDRDHNGDRIYVGRYEDPTGINKNGFNIHRHLALRPAYSAAPEILT